MARKYLCAAMLGSVAALSGGAPAWASYVEMTVTQREEVGVGTRYFGAINVDLSGVAGVAGVELGMTPTSAFPEADQWSILPLDGGSTYRGHSDNEASLAALVANQMDPYYWIRVSYTDSRTSIYTMTLNRANITADRFVGVPQITAPTNGDHGVPAGATITWTAPADATAGLPVLVEHETVVGALMTSAVLASDATSWTPGDLSNTGDKIRVGYPTADTLGSITPLSLYSGDAIAWGKSPYSAGEDGVPLLGYVSDQQITINSVPEPAVAGLLLLISSGVLARVRRS